MNEEKETNAAEPIPHIPVEVARPGKIQPEKPWPAPPAPASKNDKSVIDEETAEAEFARFLDKMDLDPDTEGLTADEKQDRSSAKRTFIKAVRRGSLVVDDKGQPVFTPQRSAREEPITFYEPDGDAIASMDKVRASAEVGRTFTLLGKVTKEQRSVFGKLKLGDLTVCSAVLTLFMGSF